MTQEEYLHDQEDTTPIMVKYQCTHLTCRLQCYTGELSLTRGRFERLKAGANQSVETGATMLKSPSMVCKIATTQDFRVIEFTNDSSISQAISNNHIQSLEQQRDTLRRTLRHKKETFKKERTELEDQIQTKTDALKALRVQERSRKVRQAAKEDK